MTRKCLRQLVLLSSTIWAAGGTAAFAQTAEGAIAPSQTATPAEAAPAQAVAAGDIVVTAQRREQRLQDVPISVFVTTGKSLEKAGTTDLLRMAERTPGLMMNNSPQSNTISIRGVGSGLNAGFEQSVGTFVDGVYRPRSRMIRAGLFDVERVEVLNGPQTTFFGNNTVAGAVNITTRKPSDTFGMDAQALYSPTDGQYIAEGEVTGPISDTLSARAGVQFSGMSGYSYNKFLGQDEPHLRDVVGRVSLRWKPTATFQSDLRVDYAQNRDRGTFGAEVTGCPAGPEYGPTKGPCAIFLATQGGVNPDNKFDFVSQAPPSSFTLDAYEAAWTNSLDLGWASLNSITSYSHQKSRTFLNATPLPATGVQGYFHQPFSQMETYGLFAQELRLQSEGGGWLEYVAGLYYSRGDLTSRSVSALYNNPNAGAAGAPVTGPTTPIGTNRNLFQIDQTRSAFGQLTANVTPQLKLNAGLRYTSVKKDATRSFRAGMGGPTALLEDLVFFDPVTEAKLVKFGGGNTAQFDDPHTTYNKLMPAASVQYEVIPSLTAYAAYAKGFKAGGYSDSNGPAQFGSEGVNSYEVGIKGSLLDRRLFFTLDGFYLDYTGLQQAITFIGPTGVSITSVGNAATSVSKGIEFSGSLQATRNISFNLAASYINSKFTNYTGGPCTALQIFHLGASCVQDLSGKPTPFAPKLSGTAGVNISVPVGDSYELTIDPSVYYASGWYMTPSDDPILRQGKYATVDLRVGIGASDNSWTLAVIGKNLTDQAIRNSGSTVGTSPGLAYSLLQRGRSVAVSLTVHR